MDQGKYALIKNIYLYLVSFVALMMAVTSLYTLLDIGLKTWVFTEAEDYYYEKPVMDYRMVDGEKVNLTEEEIQAEEEKEKERREQNRRANLQNDLARSIAIFVIAVPLFAYHWYLVRRKESHES